MSFSGLKLKRIFTVYQKFGDIDIWYDVCSFKSQFAANGYIEFQKELDKKHKERFPDSEPITYKCKETQLFSEE